MERIGYIKRMLYERTLRFVRVWQRWYLFPSFLTWYIMFSLGKKYGVVNMDVEHGHLVPA